MKKFFRCFFAPGANSAAANLGLLVLRVWIGLEMLLLHGWDKLNHFNDMAAKFPDLLHIGSKGNLVLAVFAECVCSALLVLGLFTRFAALVLAINMSVAFFMVHKMVLTAPPGEPNGEPAFFYLAVYVTLLIAGAGQFSADGLLFRKGSSPSPSSK